MKYSSQKKGQPKHQFFDAPRGKLWKDLTLSTKIVDRLCSFGFLRESACHTPRQYFQRNDFSQFGDIFLTTQNGQLS